MIALQSGSITDATELLARLRLGEEVYEVARVIGQRPSTQKHHVSSLAEGKDDGTRQERPDTTSDNLLSFLIPEKRAIRDHSLRMC